MTKLERFIACVVIGMFFATVIVSCNQTSTPPGDEDPTTGTLPTSTPTETYF